MQEAEKLANDLIAQNLPIEIVFLDSSKLADTPLRKIPDRTGEIRVIKIGEFDRIYYLTSEQERKRKELQKLKLKIKDEMYVIMRQFQHVNQEQEVVSS